MDLEIFREQAHQLVDWIADYLSGIEKLPIKPQLKPGDIYDQVAAVPPKSGQDFDLIWSDFKDKILPGVVHWQHPGFMAFFPANSSPPSVLAEMLTAALANQCMMWETSPAATELEQKMMEWLSKMLDLPTAFTGVIQDTASTATLCALLTAREQVSGWTINQKGFENKHMRIYASDETHSSIEKGVKIAGFGADNLIQIPTDEKFRLDASSLEKQIVRDKGQGLIPTCVVATLGTTGVTAIDCLESIAQVCIHHGVWLHVDAAYAGSALILPEFRWMAHGLEYADSFVFNPHKWLLTNFDCTAYYVKDKSSLIHTFEILPEYLKNESRGKVNDYRDWGIPLGRRFRALKLWFVIRSYGVDGLQKILRLHIDLAKEFEDFIGGQPCLQLAAPRTVNLVCFRYHPGVGEEEELDQLNAALLAKINQSGSFFLTHTKVNGRYTIRAVFGQTYLQRTHLDSLKKLIQTLVNNS